MITNLVLLGGFFLLPLLPKNFERIPYLVVYFSVHFSSIQDAFKSLNIALIFMAVITKTQIYIYIYSVCVQGIIISTGILFTFPNTRKG